MIVEICNCCEKKLAVYGYLCQFCLEDNMNKYLDESIDKKELRKQFLKFVLTGKTEFKYKK